MKTRLVSLSLLLVVSSAGSLLSACSLSEAGSSYMGRGWAAESMAFSGWQVSSHDGETIGWEDGWISKDPFWFDRWWRKDARAHDRFFHFRHEDARRSGWRFAGWGGFDGWHHWGDSNGGDPLLTNVAQTAVTPEPASYLLFSSGLLALGLKLRRRKQA